MSSHSTPQFSESSISEAVQDEERLKALRRYRILDTEPEPAFDRITRLAAHLFEVPTALINFVVDDRQWFKSKIGFDEHETGLDVSFCVYTVEKGDVFVVENLAEDERFADNPYVTEHGARFYAGTPLITPDEKRLGTLCVLDTEPRSPTQETLDRLADLAGMVVDELELRREQAEHRQARADLAQSRDLLRHTQRLAEVGGWEYDPQTDTLTWTDETYRIHDLPLDAEVNVDRALNFYTEESRPVIQSHIDRLLEEGGSYDMELTIETAEGRTRRVRTMGKAYQQDGETTRLRGGFQDVTERRRTERLTEVQSRFFEHIATGAPIDEVLEEITRFTEREMSDVVVSILYLDDDRLYHAAGPSLPDEFVEAIDGIEIGPKVGTCGTAAYQKEEEVTEDIKDDANWQGYREIAERGGFRSCYSQVIRGSDETVLGTFAIYGSEPWRPNSKERELVGHMSHVASVAMERDQRERDLRESEERWRTLVDDHPGPIHVTVDGRYVYANNATADLLGVESPDVLIGEDVFQFAHPDDREQIRERARRLHDERKPTPLFEHKVIRRDGHERIVLVHSVPITYRGEEAAQTMMWDVTERRRAEHELRQSEEKFRTVVENAQPVVFMIDQEGTFRLSEGKDLESLGLEPGEIVGESVYDVYGDVPEIIDGIGRALNGEHIDNVVEVGGLVFDNWYSPLYDEEGSVRGVMGMSADITQHRRRQQQLQQTQQRYRALVENFPGAVFLYDDALRCTLAGGKALEQVGMAAEEVEGTTPRERYPEEIAEPLMDALQAALHGEKQTLDQRLRGRDYRVQAVPVREGATCMAVSLDVTEQEMAKRELQDQKEMFQAVFENVPVLLSLGVGESVDLVNRHFEEVTGWSQEEVDEVAEVFEQFYPDEELREEVFAFVEEMPDEWRDFPLRAKDGTVVETTWRNVELSDGTHLGIGVDISERKERERELREANQRLRLALDAANAGTFDHDLATDQVFWDERSLELYGMDFDPEFRSGDLVRGLVLEEDLDHLEGVVGQAVQEGKERYEVSYRYHRADTREVRCMRSYGLIQRDESGTAERIIGINQDVTEREHREEQLRLLEAAVEHSLLTVLITEAEPLDEPGPKTVYANPAFTRVTGYDREEIIGQSPRFLQGPDTDQETLDRIQTALEKNESVRETVLNYRKDGTPYWNDLLIAPVRNDEGEVTHFVSIQDDVTERKRRKRVLERQNDLFAKAQDLASVGAWEYAISSGDSVLTDEVYRIHGLSPDAELSPERSLQFYHPEDQATIREAFWRAVEEGEPYDLELRLITEDGKQRWVHTRGEPQREDGEIVRVRGTIQDVTQRVRQREELQEAKEAAEEGDRIKSALLSNMNHEFRTPLTSIITFSELIRETPEIADRFVDRILGGGKRLLYTLNTVMDFAELEGDGLSVTPKPFHVKNVMHSVVNDYRKRARRKGLDLSVEIGPDVGAVTLDEHLVERILTHLLHNAVKFTEEGTVTVVAQTDGAVVELRVVDTGVGIDPAFLPQVFDEFAQASSGYDRTHEGNGLGLTIVKRLVEAMDGTVDVESELGVGTTVSVRLPLAVGGEKVEE